MMRFGLGMGSNGGVPFEPESLTLFSAMPTQPDGTRKGIINTLVSELKAAGSWATFDNLAIPALLLPDDPLINWVNPGTDDMTVVGTQIHYERDLGYFGEAPLGNGRVENTVNVNTLTNYQQDDGHISWWVIDEKTQQGMGLSTVGTGLNATSGMWPKIAGNNIRFEINNLSNANGNVAWGFNNANYYNKRGWFMANRANDSANVQGFYNGALHGTAAAASTTRLAAKFNALYWSYMKFAIASIGSSMTEAMAAATYAAFEKALKAVGAYQEFTGAWTFDWTANATIESDEGYILPVNYSTPICIYDWELKPVFTVAEEVGWDGFRRVRNLFNAAYDDDVTFATQSQTLTAGTYVVSFTGTGQISFSGTVSGSPAALVGQGASVRVSKQITATAGSVTFTLGGDNDVRMAQLENVTQQTNKNPSEFVSKGQLTFPYHGCGVDGIKYFNTQNGNTVASELVTEASGSALSTTDMGLANWFGATNRCLQSENFGTTWAAVGTPTRSAAALNCGAIVLDLIGDDDGAALEGYTQAISGMTDSAQTYKGLSVFIAEGTSTESIIRWRDTTAGADRVLASVTWSGGLPVITMTTGNSYDYETLSDGTFRLLLQAVGVVTGNTNQIEIYPATDAALAVGATGNVYVGGVQVEENTVVTRYVPTTTAVATRADNDLRDYERAGLTWVNASEGTFVCEATLLRSSEANWDGTTGHHAYLFSFHDNSDSGANRIFINLYPESVPQDIACQCIVGGVQQSGLAHIAWPTGETHKVAYSYKANSLKQSFDGGAVATDSGASLPARLDGFLVGNGNGALGQKSEFNGRLRKLQYLASQPSDATLQTLSTI